jgi:6-phospho-beta-glucosidase
MKKAKIVIIGAGSSYTPELVEKLSRTQDAVPVDELRLMDIDEKRMDIVAGFCRRYAARLGFNLHITTTTSRAQALDGVDFVDVQLRVGGNAARINDEKIPLKYGLIGQETTGPGGMMKGFRTIPVMLDIARDVEIYSPNAWIINYTNPTGLVSEAINTNTRAKILSLCSGGLFPGEQAARKLQVPVSTVRYDYIGLNHMNFAYNFTIEGRKITDEEYDAILEDTGILSTKLLRRLRLYPSPYLQYYFETSSRIKHLREAKQTRGEEVLALEKKIFAAYADPSINEKPQALAERGGGGYSDVAISVISAIWNNCDAWIIANVPNQGTIQFLPDDAVIETPCIINAAGARPLIIPDLPQAVWGLISAVKNYEQLAVKAAVEGSRELAELALLAHPLVGDYGIIVPLLDDLLEANRQYLPQFFKDPL